MLINLVLHEIDIIIQKQIMIVKINAEVEDRRVRLMEVNQSSEELQLSSETRKNILENVSNMKMEVLRTTKVYKETVEDDIGKRCRYNNKEYCKFRNECKFVHSRQVCGKFLRDGKCDSEKLVN